MSNLKIDSNVIPVATSTTKGGIKVGSVNGSAVTMQAAGTQNYAVNVDSNDLAYVSLPVIPTNAVTAVTINGTTKQPTNGVIDLGTVGGGGGISEIPVATSEVLGGIKIGYEENGRNYPVELGEGNKAFVNVPWTGTVTKITPGTGLTGASSDNPITSEGTIKLKTASTSEIGGIKVKSVNNSAATIQTAGTQNYAVNVDSNNLAYVSLPVIPTNAVTAVTINGSTNYPTNGVVDLGTVGGGGGSTSVSRNYTKNKYHVITWPVDMEAPACGVFTIVCEINTGYSCIYKYNISWCKGDDASGQPKPPVIEKITENKNLPTGAIINTLPNLYVEYGLDYETPYVSVIVYSGYDFTVILDQNTNWELVDGFERTSDEVSEARIIDKLKCVFDDYNYNVGNSNTPVYIEGGELKTAASMLPVVLPEDFNETDKSPCIMKLTGVNTGTGVQRRYHDKLMYLSTGVLTTPQILVKKLGVGSVDSSFNGTINYGTAGQVLVSGGSSGNCYWADLPTGNAGTVTAVKINGATKQPTNGVVDLGTWTDTNTKNTAGATNSTSKLYIIGSKEQSAYPQTYSNQNVYIQSSSLFASGGFFEASDENLKVFGDKVNVDLDELSHLKKNYFTWKDGEDKSVQIGVSAQEIQVVYPEIVKTREDGTLVVAYDKLSVIALAAIDKLHSENQELKARLEALENKLK